MEQEINLPLARNKELTLTPTIYHSLAVECMGFGDPIDYVEQPFRHRFDLVVTREEWENSANDAGIATSDHRWATVRRMYELPPLPTERDHCTPSDGGIYEADNALWLSYLEIGEMPAKVAECNGGWYDTCDQLGDSVRAAMPVILSLAQNDADERAPGALIDGALLWPSRLGVHPLARGQEIGLRLLAHGLWMLQRSTSDIAIIEASPVRSHFDVKAPGQPAASVRALTTYYGRLGFQRCYPRSRFGTVNAGLMFLPLGYRGMRAVFGSNGAAYA